MKIGDFVKGLPSATEHYGITTEKMTRGLVTAVSENEITVKVLEHTDGGTGTHRVDPKCFEVIGHVKPFDRTAVIKLIADGCAKNILDYDLSDADLSGVNLSRADLSDADLSGVNLSRADLSRADLSDADLRGADLSRADLSDADLRGADLRGADLSRADLSDADLRGADLSGVNLSRADLSRADLRGVNLSRADLRGADLDFSCWPLWCGSLGVKVCKRIACQLAYHFCRLECDDAEYIQARNAIIGFANQFHRVGECGKLEERALE